MANTLETLASWQRGPHLSLSAKVGVDGCPRSQVGGESVDSPPTPAQPRSACSPQRGGPAALLRPLVQTQVSPGSPHVGTPGRAYPNRWAPVAQASRHVKLAIMPTQEQRTILLRNEIETRCLEHCGAQRQEVEAQGGTGHTWP